MAVKWTAVDADVDDDADSITLIRSSVMPQRRAALSDVITHSCDAAVTHSRHEGRNVKRRATHFPVLPVAVRRNGTAPHYGADSRLDDDDRKWQASAGLPQSVRSVRRSAILFVCHLQLLPATCHQQQQQRRRNCIDWCIHDDRRAGTGWLLRQQCAGRCVLCAADPLRGCGDCC